MKHKKLLATLIVPVIFFLVSLLTNRDYGISWDEPIHFFRGQAYLHFFLTGKKDYTDMGSQKRSFYQNDSLTKEYFSSNDSGHPPINGILAAFTNLIFYQKLDVMGDIESYHLFNILSAVLLLLVVSFFAYETYGVFASLVAGIVLATYPLFFSEAHFNIKDPTETAFYALTIWAFWLSTKRGSWTWLLLSVISFALALGTKFNILFLPFILIPYLVVRYRTCFKEGLRGLLTNVKNMPRKYLLTFILAPLIIMVIFFGSWPYLWGHPVNNFSSIIHYYKDIGTGGIGQPGYFLPLGFNAYPLVWILITTPPWVLVLTFSGLVFAIYEVKRREHITVLWLLWFLVPIIRVSLPGTSVYGGVRQIMEYLPAMALLAGVGAFNLSRLLKIGNKIIIFQIIIILLFIPHLFVLAKLHPNENVYFNTFVGGLPGARDKKVPYWGNSFGNAYFQAVQWINKNAESDAKLALIQGTITNVPKIQVRKDIHLSNQLWSGINRNGEYLLELTYNDSIRIYEYEWDYVNQFLDPVYEVKADGVAIAKVWKNDLQHTKANMQKKEISYSGFSQKITNSQIIIDLGQVVNLTRIVVSYDNDGKCEAVEGVVSIFNGKSWREEEEKLPGLQVAEIGETDDRKVRFFFPARPANVIKLIPKGRNSCLFKSPTTKIFILSND